MEIQADLLISYLEKMNLNDCFTETVIDFGDEGITMGTFYLNKLLVKTIIPKDLFVEYSALGKLYIKDLSKFIDKLKKHSDKDNRVSISKSEFHIHVEDTKEKLTFKERFAEAFEIEELPVLGVDWTKEFSTTIESSELKKFFTIASVYKKPDMLIEVDGNKLKLKIYHSETDETTVKTISLGSMLPTTAVSKKSSIFDVDAMNLIVSRLQSFTKSKVYIMNDGPIRVIEINPTTKIKAEYVLAPLEAIEEKKERVAD